MHKKYNHNQNTNPNEKWNNMSTAVGLVFDAIDANEGTFINKGHIIFWSPEDGSGIIFTLGAYKDGKFSVPLVRGDNPKSPLSLKIWNRIADQKWKMWPPELNNVWSVKSCRDGTAVKQKWADSDPVVVGSPEFPVLARMESRRDGGLGPDMEEMIRRMNSGAAGTTFSFSHTF